MFLRGLFALVDDGRLVVWSACVIHLCCDLLAGWPCAHAVSASPRGEVVSFLCIIVVAHPACLSCAVPHQQQLGAERPAVGDAVSSMHRWGLSSQACCTAVK